MKGWRKGADFDISGMIDTHIHPAPDIKPRLLNDVEVAREALKEGMKAVTIKSHVESTASRALIASQVTGMEVIGGITLNKSVGGLNPDAVETSARLSGRFVWMPTISRDEINIFDSRLEDILNIIAENDMILATGHLRPHEILEVIDLGRSAGIKRIMVNHPLSTVVNASLDEQKDMARHAFLEHCLVACMPLHDHLPVGEIVGAIEHVGYKRCIIATDFGQEHNPSPISGIKWFIGSLVEHGLKEGHVRWMCSSAPSTLIY